MRKRALKYFLVIAVLAGSALVLLYAQRGYIFRSPAAQHTEQESADDKTDDIGQPTNDNPWKEMESLVKAYYDEKGVTYKGIIKLIDDNGDKEKVLEEHPFEYAVLQDNFYYSLDKIEVVHNKNLTLVADNSNKLVSVSDRAAPAQPQQRLFDIGEFKELMKERKAEAKVTQLGNEKILTIENIQDPQIQGYRIYYDPKTYRISKMLVGMIRLSPLDEDEGGTEPAPSEIANKQDQSGDGISNEEEEQAVDTYTYYLEIGYKESGIMNVTADGFHPEYKFISNIGGKMVLTPAYQKYQLILNSQETEEKKIPDDREEQ